MDDLVTKDFVIPTVDIGPYLDDPGSQAAQQVVQDVKTACTTSGFFSLKGHGISKELQQQLLRAAKSLFSLPLEDKRALSTGNVLKNRGYEVIGAQLLQPGALPDLKEGFYVGQPIPAGDERARRHPFFMGENVFPPNVPDSEIKEPTELYFQAVFQLSLKVIEILAKGLPYGDGIFDDFVSNDPVCTLRLLHYPPQTSRDELQLGAGAHTDFGAITLLYQDNMGGLEVRNPSTGQWVPVAPDPDAYVVNIGDMLAIWTRGIYKSTLHRVINRSGGDRYSVPFFFDGNLDVRLAPLDGSGCDGGEAPTVEEHMLERFGTTYKGGKKG